MAGLRRFWWRWTARLSRPWVVVGVAAAVFVGVNLLPASPGGVTGRWKRGADRRRPRRAAELLAREQNAFQDIERDFGSLMQFRLWELDWAD